MPDYVLELEAVEKGYKQICGVDEAGRGPLAGPVFAAAVILPLHAQIEGLDDSKKLSEKKREALYPVIQQIALDYAVVSVDEKLIDRINILQATMQAMELAVGGLTRKPDFVLIDGNRCPQGNLPPCEAVVKGDAKSMSIAAASVLAKVSRDHYMLKMAEQYSEYGFEKHKGYGTKEHIQNVLTYGPCEIHRLSFLRKII